MVSAVRETGSTRTIAIDLNKFTFNKKHMENLFTNEVADT